MTTKKIKLNNGCIRIFKFIRLLYEDRAYYKDVLKIFKDEASEQSTNNIQVVMNKYLNTLKVFGIKVIKVNNKFQTESNLYSLVYNLDDLKSLSILINSCLNFPDKDISQNVDSFVKSLLLRMDNESKITLNNLLNNYDFTFYYSNLREQIEYCKQVCKEHFLIKVSYTKDNNDYQVLCTPKEVIYDTKTAYLSVYDGINNQKTNIPLPCIKHIVKLPQKSGEVELPVTVVYRLKNRLAKTYKIKENEYTQGYDEDGHLVVINKNEPFDKLLPRLMRYMDNCEILSPKYLREQMISLINTTLENYNFN